MQTAKKKYSMLLFESLVWYDLELLLAYVFEDHKIEESIRIGITFILRSFDRINQSLTYNRV